VPQFARDAEKIADERDEGDMIQRVFRTRVPADDEGPAIRAIREAWLRDVPDGLLNFRISRRLLDSGELEIMASSLWRDWASLERFLGPEGAVMPRLIPGLGEIAIDPHVEVFEVIADGLPARDDIAGSGS
jgi:hypothetical protein